MIQRVCPDCGATWVGLRADPCGWCADRLTRDLDDQRRRLLWPDWLTDQGPRYDELDPDDQAVWDRTRGITRGSASVAAWRDRLAQAVAAELITPGDAHMALTRARTRTAA